MNSEFIWWIEVFVGIVGLIAIQYGIKVAITRTEKRHDKGWKVQAGKIFRLPLTILIGTLGCLYFIDLIGERTGLSILIRYLPELRKAAIVGCFAWIFFRWKKEIETMLLAHYSKKIDLTTIHIVSRLATMVVGILSGLIILQIFGVNIAPLIAFGGIGAASVGFASKDVIANFCSGIILHITRPFVIGEQIYFPEKNLEGYIEDIGWFRLSIRDKDKRPVYLPNNFISTMIVVNVSRMTHRHIKQQLKIGFKDLKKVGQLVDRIREHLKKCPEIDTDYPIHVFLKSFGEYACEIEIEAYSKLIDQDAFNRSQHKILLEIQSILEEMGVDIAIPTMYWKEGS